MKKKLNDPNVWAKQVVDVATGKNKPTKKRKHKKKEKSDLSPRETKFGYFDGTVDCYQVLKNGKLKKRKTTKKDLAHLKKIGSI